MNSSRNLLFAVIAIAAVAGYSLGGVSFHTPSTVSEMASPSTDSDDGTTQQSRDGESASVEWSHSRDGSNANAEEHWRKHGGEFSEDHNAREYEDEASSFVHHPPPNAEIKHRANGDDGTTQQSRDGERASVEWSHGRDGSNTNAEEHWRKHGGEFSEDHNAREYEDEASSFVHHPPPNAEIKHRANGDTLIYDHETNTFAVENRDGVPRTMFKPDRGEAYWDRQH